MTKRFAAFAAIILAVYIPLILISNAHFPFSDGAEHGAAVRGLAENPIHPEDPMLAGHPGKSARYVPSIYLMGLTMRAFQLDIITTIKLFSVFYFLLFLFCVTLFSREYFNDPGQAPWTLATLLFLWGLGWKGANAYMFAALLQTSWYPSLASFSLSLLALYCQLRFLRSSNKWFFTASLALGALSFVNHLITGGFFLVCSGLIYLNKFKLKKKTFLYYGITLAVTLTLTLLWPFYDFIATTTRVLSGQMGQASDYNLTRTYLTSYQSLFLRAGPALFGIPFLIMFIFQKRYFLLLGNFAVFAGIYIGSFFLEPSLIERSIFFIIFSMHMAFSRICREWFSHAKPAITKKASRFLVFLLLCGVILQVNVIVDEYLRPSFMMKPGSVLPCYKNPNSFYLELRKYLNKDAVVLSDLYTSWGIPVFTGAKIVSLFHTPAHVKDNIERINDLDTFYDITTPKSLRHHILKKYSVTHILLNTSLKGQELEDIIKEMGFQVIARTESYCLFLVIPEINQADK